MTMFSFLRQLNNAAQGKPIFDDQNQQTNLSNPGQDQVEQNSVQNPLNPAPQPAIPLSQSPIQQIPQPPEQLINKADSRTFPVLCVRRTSVYTVNGQMEIKCHLINNFSDELDVDKILLLGRQADIRYKMKPGEDKEFSLYKGPTMPSTQYNDVKIIYKTHAGDFFETVHDIRYSAAPDKTYVVADIKLHPPVRDIFG